MIKVIRHSYLTSFVTKSIHVFRKIKVIYICALRCTAFVHEQFDKTWNMCKLFINNFANTIPLSIQQGGVGSIHDTGVGEDAPSWGGVHTCRGVYKMEILCRHQFVEKYRAATLKGLQGGVNITLSRNNGLHYSTLLNIQFKRNSNFSNCTWTLRSLFKQRNVQISWGKT